MTKTEELLSQEMQNFHMKQSHYSGYKSRGVYDLDKIEDPLGIQSKHSLSSLTLLKVNTADELHENDEILEEGEFLERPSTPINESIRLPPKTYKALCRHVRRRINPRPYWTHVSVEDQLSLSAVLLGEVNAVWSGFRKQVDDPFLTPKQNRELQRRITVHIVTVCEQLFLYYCEQVKVLNARGVFTEEANMSRIRGEIATSAGKYLNLLTVRRHIIEDLRKAEKDLVKLGKTTDPITPEAPKTPRKLSFHNLIETTRSKKRVPSYNLTQEIRDMKKQMPVLDLNLAYSLIPVSRMQDRLEEVDMVVMENTNAEADLLKENIDPLRKIRSWTSEPNLRTELLSEAFSDDEEILQSPSLMSTSRTKQLQPNTRFPFRKRRHVSSALLSDSKGGYFDLEPSIDLKDPREDLKNLMRSHSKTKINVSEENTGIPPLIQAITRRQLQEAKMQKLKKEGEELDARNRELDEKERKPLPEPKFPQLPVVQTEIPGHANPVNSSNVTIRTADMHVPDRVELPDVALQINGPLANDLIGEISPATVKELDANLFQGEELKEVYLEIMKTVPNDHLMFDNDELVMKPIEKVNLNKTFASSTLILPRQQRIINPKLKRVRADPPWLGVPQELWERNGKPASVGNISAGKSTQPSGFPLIQAESRGKALKAHASWLAWWKATINTDDYFKYLSTKDTDFLSVIFHFYDSEISESEHDLESRIALLEETRKRDEFIRDVRAKKENFVPGLWNVNVVRLGGLGRYPNKIDNAKDVDFESPAEDDADDDEQSSTKKSESVKASSYGPTASISGTATSPRTESPLEGVDFKTSRSLQSRFEVVWRKLRMTSVQKLNAAARYSSDKYNGCLHQVVSSWERVTDLVQRRENLMHDLENFEMEASNPHRFFYKGAKGSSANRLQEARTRSKFYQQLEKVEKSLAPMLHSIHAQYDDIVTLEGRPYHEKMSVDKVEMLYWLQQERRALQLDKLGEPEQLKQFIRDNHVTISEENAPGSRVPLPITNVTIDQKI